jgi:hypothetical protein
MSSARLRTPVTMMSSSAALASSAVWAKAGAEISMALLSILVANMALMIFARMIYSPEFKVKLALASDPISPLVFRHSQLIEALQKRISSFEMLTKQHRMRGSRMPLPHANRLCRLSA